jgi:formate-dependent nitrite reductase membrane component NrfD
MSVGAWTLVAFSSAASASAFADAVCRVSGGGIATRIVGDAAGVLAAATGLVLSTYTGVLLGATAIPVWTRHVRMLPIHFGVSSTGAAASLLELAGPRDRSLHYLALGAAAVECLLGPSFASLPAREPGTAMEPIDGNRLVRAGGLLSGPIPLALRLIAGRSRSVRQIAALAAVAGSVLSRFGWIEAGRTSHVS